MPSRNVIKQDAAETYYHVYGRGVSKQSIFVERADYQYFLTLFARYLSANPQLSRAGVAYPHYKGKIDLLAYCLMGNHFHLFVYQHQNSTMRDLMRAVLNSYTIYFNRKYERTGSLLESTYKAVSIISETHLIHISRYIHLNPRYWKRYPYSSIRAYLTGEAPQWLQPQPVLDQFESLEEYRIFLEDYSIHKEILEEIKYSLADR